MINPRPPGGGGGGRTRPPRFFLNNFRCVTGIDAKLGIPFRTSILRPQTTVWKKSWKLFELCSFKWHSVVSFFGRKLINVWEIAKYRDFRQNANKQHQMAKNEGLFKMAMSDFPKMIFFTQKNEPELLYNFFQNPKFSKKPYLQYFVESCLGI